jgi:hypothetical protein
MTDPLSRTTTTTTGTRPGTVETAFWLYLAAPVIGLILSLVSIGRVTSSAAASHLPQGAVIAGVVIGIVINVIYLIAVIVIDTFFRRGANWARIVLTVLAALSVFGVIGLGAITFVIGLVAIILSWLPASNAWFRSVRGGAAPRTV